MSQEILNGFAMCNIEKAILDTNDLNTVLMILHQETLEEVSLYEPMDIMECKYMIIKLIPEVQINYCFSLQCSPIIIKHVKYWKNARLSSRVFSTRQ